MDLQPLLPGARSLFDRSLGRTTCPLSAYSFITHALWSGHFAFSWAVHRDHLLLFAEYDRCLYMPLPPLGPSDPDLVSFCFDWMDQKNQAPGISRIENIAESDRGFYLECGLHLEAKAPEYLYRRQALAELKGDRYKSQRWACNHFEKNDRPRFRWYHPSDRDGCLALFQKWAARRRTTHTDPLYLTMLSDSESVHRRALSEADALGLTGAVLETAQGLAGYTFGFPQNRDTFCIVLEVADPTLTGAAPFLFREFCRAVGEFEWINAMDDSGLENLKKVKESYHPERRVACYLARRAG